MLETTEQIQQAAYLRGQQMKQRHREQQRVITDKALAVLAADFAHVFLFQSNQYITVVAAHERAGICAKAFLEGYRSTFP
ncbi:hypothetical protein KSF_038390 [Reticulibacter mediterranei]|uniref:Uncharacterized protein n=1 Tax=Reticulibacter mediterranei TaxID=2778369 RepID=A0A8J3IFT8_9CHLR|nr:hypothetical protein [Reticulibacter mediterranei]GHO93791.1 hypothetical protein KSF_038390 [Reticulibacter mediterranei]